MSKSAFITGGSGGLGIALTRLLAAEGWRVFAADCDDTALEALSGESNISSETGWHTAAPFNGPYAITKYGIEAYSDALRRELYIYSVPVICVQPGPFKTSLVSNTVDTFKQAARESTLYAPQLEHFGKLVYDANKKSHAPEKLAQVIRKALTVAKPKHRYSVKADMGRSLLEWLPMSVADRIFRRLLSRV